MKKNIKNNDKKDQKFGQIMGINVSVTSTKEVLAGVKQKVSHSSKLGGRNIQFSIVTPNPELVLMAQDNTELKNALNSADFSIPDGVGLKVAIPTLNIVKGRELFIDLIKLADKESWKVFFLGGKDNEAELAAKKLQQIYSNTQILTDKGFNLNQKGEPVSKVDIRLQQDIVDKINKFRPHLLFVAFGNPKQEIWIHNNLSKLNIDGAMTVGGTFRYMAGLSKLPPKWMEKLGLEWIWRLITEPFRFKRTLNAFPIFPLKVFWYKISNNK